MSRGGEVTLTYGDGEHSFRLRIGELRELQDKTGHGPESLFNRLRGDQWLFDEARETIRLGLIGSEDMKPIEALKFIDRYVQPGEDLLEAKMMALAIVSAALFGTSDEETDDAKKPTGEASADTSSSPTEN